VKSLKASGLKERLDQVLLDFNHKDYLKTDPIQIPHRYSDIRDREFAALFTSLFCFGNVTSIVKTVSQVLEPLGDSPTAKLISLKDSEISNIVGKAKYRFFVDQDIEFLFRRLRDLYRKSPSGLSALLEKSKSPMDTLIRLRSLLRHASPNTNGIRFMFPDPEAGVAKRFHMLLRWMVRRDEIDFGIWNFLSPADLSIPLDVHLFDICSGLGMTKLKSPSLKAMMEVTNALLNLDPKDPIKYDFALCRVGILGLKQEFLGLNSPLPHELRC